jgi:serine/threonine protein kinase
MQNAVDAHRDLLAGRYRLGTELGRGGFGTVFRAVDTHTRSPVAVKRLSVSDPAHLVHFKREFRMLADCRHPHLVRYEALLEDAGSWYLVLEFIDGVDVLSFVRDGHPAGGIGDAASGRSATGTPRSGITVADWLAGPDTEDVAEELPDAAGASSISSLRIDQTLEIAGTDDALPVVAPSPEALARIRVVLAHLADGLTHLHAQGLVHRDLKPRNILVDRGGRPVILDFGLVSRSRGDRVGGGVGFRVGTPRYMAPEQALGRAVTPASDWYAIGVMLYEMLTGVPPLRGAPFAVMAAKTSVVPADPRTLVPGLPADLCDLCMELLAIAPERRPTDPARRLSQGDERTPVAVEAISSGIFVGRGGPLARLESALAAVQDDDRPRMVLLRGPSGIGKSALMQNFVRRCARRLVVLRGRCFQREAVPFKALDSLADALVEHLLAHQVDRPFDLPERIGYLAQVVPVLRMIPSIDALALGVDAGLDPHERRRRAFAALRDLFTVLSESGPLVLALDDVQWSDLDSVAALADALTPARDVRVLLLATQRNDEQGRSGTGPADALVRALETAGVVIDAIDVGPLAETEATELAKLLPRSQAWRSPGVLFRESGGHPMLLRELARTLPVATGGAASLTTLLARRLDEELDAEGRRLVEAVAVAGQPRRPDVLRRVMGHCPDLGGTIDRLCALNLLRWHGSGAALAVGSYHDKVVETALAGLEPAALAAWHRRWAEAFGHHPDAEAEAVCEHWIGAGEPRRAFAVGLTAARRAGALLAFDRAAALYQRLITIAPPDADIAALRLARADALAAAGQGAASALAYAETADETGCRDQAHARSRAAGQYLRSGHIDAGVTMARRVLESFDLGWRRSSGTALVSLLWHQVRLRMRGFEFSDRQPHQIPASQVVRMDALWQLGHGLGGVDTIRGAEFHARHLLMALDAGDPYRVSRALAWEGLLAAAEGGVAGYVRAERIIERGRSIADRLSHPHAQAWNLAAAGYTNYAQARFAPAVEQSQAGMRLYRERCLDVTWEMGSLYCWCWFPALWFSGRLDDLRPRLAAVEREFDGLGDLYTVVSLRTVIKPWLHLVDGRPDVAVQEAITEVARWSRQHWHLQHLFARFAEVRAALYLGDGQLALHLLDDAYPRFRSSLQARLQGKRIFFQALRGQAALCAWRQNASEAKRCDRVVRDAIRRLERERHPWATVHVLALRAGWQACLGGDAIGGWHQAEAAFAAQGMPLYAAACRLRGGQAKAAEELQAQGVRDPERFAWMLV